MLCAFRILYIKKTLYMTLNNKTLGDLYEIQIRDHIINKIGDRAYLWSHTPEDILIDSGIIGDHNIHRLNRKENKANPLQDTGIDIIQVNKNNQVSLVQCKNGYKDGLRMQDLNGFGMWMTHLDRLNGDIYYTDKLSHNLSSLPINNRIRYIKEPFIDTIKKEKEKKKKDKFIVDQDKIKYQTDAMNLAIKYYEKNTKGMISMPCGTGKTYLSYLIASNYKQVILISPLKEFAKQNLTRFEEYGYINQTLLIDSDGTRDEEKVKDFVEKNESFVLSSTFASIDVIMKVIDCCKDVFVIIDEFHNLSKKNVTDEEDNFYKLIDSDKKILFLSATPRSFEMEGDDEFNNEIFGDMIYKMTMKEAIDKKYITDYKIWIPSIHEDNAELNKELSIYDVKECKSKCMFLYSCLMNKGSRKCIIYCNSKEEIDTMVDGMEKLNEFYCLELHMDKITSDDGKKARKSVLDEFNNTDKIALLFSVRILDECIDLPKCDSVFIANETYSKIRTVQRICRCIRTDKNNQFKVGNVFMWCDEYKGILDTLSCLKEYDADFGTKININSVNFFNKKEAKIEKEKDNRNLEMIIMGIKHYKNSNWFDKLDQIKKYVDENKKRPSEKSDDIYVRRMGKWAYQIILYMKKYRDTNATESMRIEFDKFIDEYGEYFIDNRSEEYWYKKLNEVKKYIDENKKRPLGCDKDPSVSQNSTWIINCFKNYREKTNMFKRENICTDFLKFVEEYGEYFKSPETIWHENFKKYTDYLDTYKKRPVASDKNEGHFLAQWHHTQLTSLNAGTGIMKDENLKIIFNSLKTNEKYKKYFVSNENIWYDTCKLVEEYIEKNKKKPSVEDKDESNKKLGTWLKNQIKSDKDNTGILANKEISDTFKKLKNKFPKLFMTFEEIWDENFIQLKKYVEKEGKKPSCKSTDPLIKKLGCWSNDQKKMKTKNEERYKIYNKYCEDVLDKL